MSPITSSRLVRLGVLATTLVAALGCTTKDAKRPADQLATPVNPAGFAVSISSDRGTLTATDTRFATLTIVAYKVPEWTPVPDQTQLTVTTSLGNLDNAGGGQTLTLDMFGGRATTRLYPGAVAGFARVQATVNGAIAEITINIKEAPTTGGGGTTPEPAPVASSITLSADPATVTDTVAGPTDVSLVAVVRDQSGDPIKNASVNFSTELGTLASGGTELGTNSSGEVTDIVEVTKSDLTNLSGSSFAVTATLGVVGGTTSATFNVGVTHGAAPSEAASLTITTDLSSINDDGSDQTVHLFATVRDQYGVVMNGVPVQFASDLGTPSPEFANTAGSGQAASTLTILAAAVHSFGSDSFDVSAIIGTSGGTVTQSRTITISRPPVAPLVAEFSDDGPACLTGISPHPIVTFTNLSTGSPDAYDWDLDGNGVTDNHDVNPTMDYTGFPTPSDVLVKLTVHRGAETSVIQHPVHIDIASAGGCPP